MWTEQASGSGTRRRRVVSAQGSVLTALPAPRGPKKTGFRRIRGVISVPGDPSTNYLFLLPPFPLPPPSQSSPSCIFYFLVLCTEISRRGAAHRTGWMVAKDLAGAKDPSAIQYNPWCFSSALGLRVPGLWSL